MNAIQGAWRIEESPVGHPYGLPNTHWLIVGDRVMVIRERIADPRVFDMFISPERHTDPAFIGLHGEHGGRGHVAVDGDLLFISFGENGVRPPRFASDCGLFFAFTRDKEIEIPRVENSSRDPIHDSMLGRLEWKEYLHDWTGQVSLANGEICDISISDRLCPVEKKIRKARELLAWLNDNIQAVKTACGERVREWVVPDDQDLQQFPVERFSKTVSVDALRADDFDWYLWAGTSLPIDHSLRVWLGTDATGKFVIEDVSVEG